MTQSETKSNHEMAEPDALTKKRDLQTSFLERNFGEVANKLAEEYPGISRFKQLPSEAQIIINRRAEANKIIFQNIESYITSTLESYQEELADYNNLVSANLTQEETARLDSIFSKAVEKTQDSADKLFPRRGPFVKLKQLFSGNNNQDGSSFSAHQGLTFEIDAGSYSNDNLQSMIEVRKKIRYYLKRIETLLEQLDDNSPRSSAIKEVVRKKHSSYEETLLAIENWINSEKPCFFVDAGYIKDLIAEMKANFGLDDYETVYTGRSIDQFEESKNEKGIKRYENERAQLDGLKEMSYAWYPAETVAQIKTFLVVCDRLLQLLSQESSQGYGFFNNGIRTIKVLKEFLEQKVKSVDFFLNPERSSSSIDQSHDVLFHQLRQDIMAKVIIEGSLLSKRVQRSKSGGEASFATRGKNKDEYQEEEQLYFNELYTNSSVPKASTFATYNDSSVKDGQDPMAFYFPKMTLVTGGRQFFFNDGLALFPEDYCQEGNSGLQLNIEDNYGVLLAVNDQQGLAWFNNLKGEIDKECKKLNIDSSQAYKRLDELVVWVSREEYKRNDFGEIMWNKICQKYARKGFPPKVDKQILIPSGELGTNLAGKDETLYRFIPQEEESADQWLAQVAPQVTYYKRIEREFDVVREKSRIGVAKIMERVKSLPNAGPILAEIFEKPSGVSERYSLGTHTVMVLNQYLKYFSDITLPLELSPEEMETFLCVHDSGKAQALAERDRTTQHKHTQEFIERYSKELFPNSSTKTVQIFISLVGKDPLGDYIKIFQRNGVNILDKTVKTIKDMAQEADSDLASFYALLKIFYTVDASSYTRDASIEGVIKGKRSLDGLFTFDHENSRVGFSPSVSKLLDDLESGLGIQENSLF